MSTKARDTDLERMVIGSMLSPGFERLTQLHHTLKPEWFTDTKFRRIAEVVYAYLQEEPETLWRNGELDIALLAKSAEIQLPDISSLELTGISAFQTYVLLMAEKYMWRKLDRIESEAKLEADGLLRCEKLRSGLENLDIEIHSRPKRNPYDALRERLEKEPDVVRTGLPDFDTKIGGLEAGTNTILAARPGVGKTAFLASIAINAAVRGESVLFVTYEMSDETILRRLVANVARVSVQDIKLQRLSERDLGRVKAGIDEVQGLPIVIESFAGRRVDELVFLIRGSRARLVIVDYLQQVPNSERAATQNERIEEVSGKLSAVAKSMGTRLLVASQLNRTPENDSTPLALHHLRGSGAIEQDADSVIFLHRSDYQAESTEVSDVQVIVAKARDGETGKIVVQFHRPTSRFFQVDKYHQPPMFGEEGAF